MKSNSYYSQNQYTRVYCSKHQYAEDHAESEGPLAERPEVDVAFQVEALLADKLFI